MLEEGFTKKVSWFPTMAIIPLNWIKVRFLFKSDGYSLTHSMDESENELPYFLWFSANMRGRYWLISSSALPRGKNGEGSSNLRPPHRQRQVVHSSARVVSLVCR